jgi:uncharacterized protein YggU (UPF0235/DUF167 family)
VRVRARPVDGEANAAVAVAVAGWYGIPKSRVRLAAGAAGRHKIFELPDPV